MAYHSYNHGLVTSTKGMAIEFVKITGLNGATQTVDDGNSNLVASCAKGATGVYTITLNKPYPPSLLACVPTLSAAGPTATLLTPRYVDNSYNASAGTFVVDVSDELAAAADGGATNELHLMLVFGRYTHI